jgi:single-strand DNA-binding protein
MLGEAEVTFTGNLAADPELRFTPAGDAVCNFAVVVNGQKKDLAGTWQQQSATTFRCTVWRDQAEHVAASLSRGDRVTVTGALRARTYEGKSGEKGTSLDVDVREVGVSLRFVTATPVRAARPGPVAVPAAG